MAERVGPEEKKVLRFIARREERGDPSPGVREIGFAVGLEGSWEAQDLLSGLVENGYLIRDAGWQRMLQLTGRGWRLVETLSADERGAGAQEDDGLLRAPDGARRHLLRAAPESLIRAGMSGDELLVVEETSEPGDGELIAALVEGEIVVKRLRREGEQGELVSLVPADDTPTDPGDGPVYEPSLPVSAAEIKGRVVYAVRPLEV